MILQKQVVEQTARNREENYIIKGKLAEKEMEIEATARDAEQTKQKMQEMQDEIRSMDKRFETFMDVLIRELPQTLNNYGDQRSPNLLGTIQSLSSIPMTQLPVCRD